MKRLTILTILALVMSVFTLSGCGVVTPAGKASANLTPTSKPNYTDVFDAAVKACHELDLPIILAGKDTGSIQCGYENDHIDSSKISYKVTALIERDTAQFVENVSIKVYSMAGMISRTTSDADANAFAQRYLDIMQREGVK